MNNLKEWTRTPQNVGLREGHLFNSSFYYIQLDPSLSYVLTLSYPMIYSEEFPEGEDRLWRELKGLVHPITSKERVKVELSLCGETIFHLDDDPGVVKWGKMPPSLLTSHVEHYLNQGVQSFFFYDLNLGWSELNETVLNSQNIRFWRKEQIAPYASRENPYLVDVYLFDLTGIFQKGRRARGSLFPSFRYSECVQHIYTNCA